MDAVGDVSDRNRVFGLARRKSGPHGARNAGPSPARSKRSVSWKGILRGDILAESSGRVVCGDGRNGSRYHSVNLESVPGRRGTRARNCVSQHPGPRVL